MKVPTIVRFLRVLILLAAASTTASVRGEAGSPDPTFSPARDITGSYVHSLALQADGKVAIGGNFSRMNGTRRNHLARPNADGSVEVGFDPGVGPSSGVLTVALQPDGKILKFLGQRGWRYEMQTSDDLLRWQSWTSIEAMGVSVRLVDPQAGGLQKFHRTLLRS